MAGRLNDKIALITGGASGMGAAAARLFVDEGCWVVIGDVNDALGESLSALLGDQAFYCRLDVAQHADWRWVTETLKDRFGRLDILINNAGIVRPGSPETTTIDDFRFHMSVMAEGRLLGCQHAISLMKENGGSIVNMSSIANYLGFPAGMAYGAAKGAVRNMTKTVAIHCHEMGYQIRCNSVHPGLIRTPMTEGLFDDLKIAASLIGEADDVARLLLFLASDESRFINGAEVRIDGGVTLLPPGR